MFVASLGQAQNSPQPGTGKPGTSGPAAKSPPPVGPAAAGDIRETKPEVYYVRDKDGNLVPVPDFSYEEFRRLYDLDRKLQQATAPPPYVLQAVTVEGTAGDDLAELSVRVRWLIKSPAWVQIPLRLTGGVLRDVPTYDGPGEQFVQAERGGGFVVWVQEKDPTPHTLTLRLQVPLKRLGDEFQLNLPSPVATMSELKLTVPRARLAAQVAGGGSLLSNENAMGKSTRLTAAGLGENFQLSWRPRDSSTARLLGAVEATSLVDVRVEGPRRVTSDARIKLRGLTSGLGAFRVRLPAGMEYVPTGDQGYTVEVVESQGGMPGGRVAQVVEVRLEPRAAATVEVRIRAAVPAESKQPGTEPIEMLGFDVIGAARQSGQVDVTVDSEWTINFSDRSNVLPVELSDAARQQGVVARFEFHRQPCSLLAQILPHKSRVQVEPLYIVTVGASQVRLQANLSYRLRGPATPRLQLDCTGWQVDRIEPERLTGVNLPAADSPGLVTIPLGTETLSTPREFELQVFAYLEPTRDQPLSIPIPRPLVDGPSSAIIVIAPEDNVSLSPRLAEMSGLIPEPLPPTLNLPTRLQSPLYYRARLDTDPKRFVADWRLRPRAMSATLRHALRVEGAVVRGEHRLKYVVANEPTGQVTVTLTQGARDAVVPQFYLHTGAGPLIPLTAQSIETTGTGQTWSLALPDPRVGEFEIIARLNWPLRTEGEEIPAEVELPLLVPDARDETTIVGNELHLSAEPPWRVELAPRDWHILPAESESGISADVSRYAGVESASQATLRLGRGTAGQSVLWLQNAWIQTWLGRNVRHDRGVWKLLAYANHVQVQLPSGANVDEAVVAVDGTRTGAELDSTGLLRIALPADGREHVIEVAYFVPRHRFKVTRERMELPRLLAGNSAPRFLWQLVAPLDEHLVGLPRDLTPEMRWSWRGAYWERQGIWPQRELERWSGGARQEELPRETNQYLFSAIGTVDMVEYRVWPRALLVTLASAGVLAIGILVIYVRPLRHPLAMSIGGIVLLGAAIAVPETALLIAQAAALGWALAMLARLLRGKTGHRRAQVLVRSTRSSVQNRPPERGEEPGGAAIDGGEVPPTTATAGPALSAPAVPK